MDKKYLLRIISYVALALAALVLIADIGIQIGSSMVQEVETATTELISTGENIRAKGYIVRSESVLEAQTNGYLGYSVEDGERVSAGSVIGSVYPDSETNRTLLRQISEIDRKIELINEAESVKGIYTVVSADQRIDALRQQADKATAEGSPIETALEEELLVMLYVREMRSGKSYDEIKAQLLSERNELKAELGAPGQTVTAGKLGYFYSQCDGYETVIDSESLMSATIDELDELLNNETVPEISEKAVGKIVTDYTWYLVCTLPTSQVRGMSEAERYSLQFDGEKIGSISMKLSRLVYEYGNETSALVFESTDMPDGFEYTRFQTVTIEQESFNGYRVPVSAIRNLNGITGVYILRGSIVEFREIRPINVQDGVVTVDADAEASGEYKMLEYYDRIIVKGKDLYVGKIID